MESLANTLFIGQNLICLEKTDSTNSQLRQLCLSENLPEGASISATYQTGGRGQRGTVWESEKGENILLSILLYPKFLNADNQFILSQTIALGIKDFVSEVLNLEVKIKWPNDILVDKKKVAGILIENTLEGNQIKNCIAGMGVNINQKNLLPTATSLSNISGEKYIISEAMNWLFSSIEKRYLQLRQGDTAGIKQDYLKNLYGINSELNFINLIDESPFKGIINGVGREGKLEILVKDISKSFDLKEIKFL